MSTTANISVDQLDACDCPVMADAFSSQGWSKPREQFVQYLHEQTAGYRIVFVANVGGEFKGYVSVVWNSNHPFFMENSVPEIVDLNVLKKFQRRGIGTRLMDVAERMIAERSEIAGIRVGLTADYGTAQRLYIKRGYIPDGNGISQNGRYLNYRDAVTVDDDLTLAFIKRVRD
jgi:ribosomal protein S18 acetylase RimI-like enzyme